MRRTKTLAHEFAPVDPQHSVYLALTEADRTQADRETHEISVIAEPFGLLRKPRVLGSGLGSHPASLAHPLYDAVGLSLTEVGTNPEVLHADHPSDFGRHFAELSQRGRAAARQMMGIQRQPEDAAR